MIKLSNTSLQTWVILGRAMWVRCRICDVRLHFTTPYSSRLLEESVEFLWVHCKRYLPADKFVSNIFVVLMGLIEYVKICFHCWLGWLQSETVLNVVINVRFFSKLLFSFYEVKKRINWYRLCICSCCWRDSLLEKKRKKISTENKESLVLTVAQKRALLKTKNSPCVFIIPESVCLSVKLSYAE